MSATVTTSPRPLLQGREDEAGAVTRVPAAEVEAIVTAAVREHFSNQDAPADDRSLIAIVVGRVEVRPDGLAITIGGESLGDDPGGQANEGLAPGDGADEATSRMHEPLETSPLEHHHTDGDRSEPRTIWVPWRKRLSRRRREIMVPTGVARSDTRPIRVETRPTLVTDAAAFAGRDLVHGLDIARDDLGQPAPETAIVATETC